MYNEFTLRISILSLILLVIFIDYSKSTVFDDIDVEEEGQVLNLSIIIILSPWFYKLSLC